MGSMVSRRSPMGWFTVLLLAGGLTLSSEGQLQKLEGKWTGSTSQEKPISFTVAGDAVTRLKLEWRLPFSEPCVVAPGSGFAPIELSGTDDLAFPPNSPGEDPPKITAAGWKLERDLPRIVRLGTGAYMYTVLLTVSATFKGSESSGILVLTAKGCKGSAKVTWKATKNQ